MDAAGAPILAIDAADFGAGDETDAILPVIIRPVIPIQAVGIGDELRLELLGPGGMGKIAGGEEVEALAPGGGSQVGQGQRLAARKGVGGMEVEVGAEGRRRGGVGGQFMIYRSPVIVGVVSATVFINPATVCVIPAQAGIQSCDTP